ncbi:MAG: putative metal-binding motif-containing protein [Sandaracinaceae bacterium]|nr:putative metal-binding motif-containing protein [Sandaracinaceae bacterium]MBK7774682.1 putative metal-binding motif-containing protein [Sandaracinaceae bacterium]MBK8410789.1 putative metal-binding motif-containing protein [Sandaracinaceae bacterium]
MRDADGDGFLSISCGGNDCDDEDPHRFPGNIEVCDDGLTRQRDEDCDPTTFGFQDADADGEVSASCCNTRADGTLFCGSDCDDRSILRRAFQVELCDVVDNDCDGVVDEQTMSVEWYADADGDGFGEALASMSSCTPVPSHSLSPSDCDDSEARRHPAQLELCDLVDNDCDSRVDEGGRCGAVVTLDASGGSAYLSLESGLRASLHVPVHALSAPVIVSMREMTPAVLAPLPSGFGAVGTALVLTPYGLQFDVAIAVALPTLGDGETILVLDNETDGTWTLLATTRAGGVATGTHDSSGIYLLAALVCVPTLEICDGLDNDCDGLIDDGVCA